MSAEKIVIFYGFYLLLLCYLSCAQLKANQKCAEYQELPQNFKKPGINIVGGRLARNDEFPHMVVLGYGPKNDRKWLCGGTIISKNHILTAAHCTNQLEFGPVKIVRVGATNLKRDTGVDIPVKNIIKHPNYKPPSLYNDIAILKLRTDIEFFRTLLPACLNTISDVRSRTSKLVATGWGLLKFGGEPSSNLMKVDLNLYTYGKCNSAFKNVSKRKLARGIDNSTQICAGSGPNEEKDTCQGDSGGPLAMKTGGIYSVVGITSFGKSCGIPDNPGVYTKVSAYVPWIEKIVWP